MARGRTATQAARPGCQWDIGSPRQASGLGPGAGGGRCRGQREKVGAVARRAGSWEAAGAVDGRVGRPEADGRAGGPQVSARPAWAPLRPVRQLR